MGGRSIAIGTTQTELKSRVSPALVVYAIRGVDAIDTIPQVARTRNLTRSSACQSVCAAAMTMNARAPTIGVATYQRSSGGSSHHAQSFTTKRLLRRVVRDEGCIFHRSVCDTCYCLLVAAHRKGLAAYSYHNPSSRAL